MDVDIKNQHYVWRHYLKPWMSNNKIWCARDSSPFNINPEKIAKEDYFYSADQLNSSEKMLIEFLIKMIGQGGQFLLNSIYQMYITSSYASEQIRKNTIEKYHGMVERSAISILEKIYSGDLGFWNQEEERIRFSGFIGLQYTRTKKTIERLTIALNNLKSYQEYPKDANPKKIAKVLSLLIGEKIGNWLYSSSQPKLLVNNSETGFITSDQPVCNLLAEPSDYSISPKEVKLYFPISPKIALIFENKNETEKTNNYDFDLLNRFILKSSREYVFSHSKQLLSRYKKRKT
jgi:hypothetical protein